MKKHEPGTYPMYHIEKIIDRKTQGDDSHVVYEKRRVELCHTEQINVGDKIQYRNKHDLTFNVLEVLDERKAKGNHPNLETKWYNLILEYQNK